MRKLLPLMTIICLLLSACGGSAGAGQNPPDGGNPSACRENLTSDITIPTLLENGPEACDYFIPNQGSDNQMLTISSDLRIEPGTVIIVDQDVLLDIDMGGSITAVGTPGQPIVLKGSNQVHGYWYGLCFDGNRESTLDHVQLLNAGKTWTGLSRVCEGAISGVTGGGEPVNIRNSLIAGSSTSGISTFGFQLGEFTNNVLADNKDYGIRVRAEHASHLDNASDYSGATQGSLNGRPYVLVTGILDDHSVTHTWRNLNAPYFTGYEARAGTNIIVTNGAKLVIEAGTRHVFGDEGGIFVDDDASFAAIGTAGAPIIFTGENEVPGQWEGLHFTNANTVQLEYVEVSWGGYGDEYNLGAGNVVLWGDQLLGGAVLNEVTFRGSETCGLNMSSDIVDMIDGTELQFIDNAKPGCVDGNEQELGG